MVHPKSSKEEEKKPPFSLKSWFARVGKPAGCLVVVGTALGVFFSRLNFHLMAMHRSVWQAAVLVGTEVGAVVMTSMLLLLIPRVIITWTTIVVFEFLFQRIRGHGEEVIEDGRKMARELSISTLKRVVTEGNFIALVVGLFFLIFSFFSKHFFEESFARAK